MREAIIQRMTRWTVFGVILDDALFFENIVLFVFGHTSWLLGMLVVGILFVGTVVLATITILLDSSTKAERIDKENQ
ncbi:hypothetical protein [Lacticaseibacillus porcinae]|uniref:hypothetical protein n=1 Tax=Lacticaseibacillus porcinae TaxID=1123687 RepID=UPI000F779C2C|nr:hypothetical protein [Lacticaseibacillus porcinae]